MRTYSRIFWLLIILLVALFTMAGPVLAQPQPPFKPGLSMRLVSSDYSNPVKPGADNSFQLMVSNIGSGTVTNVRLTSFQPRDWVIEFNPQMISQIPQNGLQAVDVIIRPPENAGRGYQNVTFTAQAVETSAVFDFSVNVEGGTSMWLWIGIALAVVVLGAFIFIFIRIGRQ